MAKEVYTNYWQFRRTPLDTAALKSAGKPSHDDDDTQSLAGGSHAVVRQLLRFYQQLARDNVYTPVMVLGAVTNKKLDTSVRPLSDEEALAHTYTTFVRTERLLERLTDASSSDREFSGLSERIRATEYARSVRSLGWHSGLDDALVVEGTARSSSFLRPTTTYYRAEQHDAAKQAAVARYNATVALLRELPRNVVSVEIPNRRVDDDSGAVAADRTDVSDFYKNNSALYVSAFREANVLDLAFAERKSSGGELVHGVRFTRFSEPEWRESLRLVPYNQLSDRTASLTTAVLEQLEPIPTLRRPAERAAAVEREGAPRALRRLEALFADEAEPARSSSVLLSDPTTMPLPPSNIVLTLRAEDVSDSVAQRVVQAVAKTRSLFKSAHVHTRYLSDVPVRGDQSSLPEVILYDVELRLVE